MLKRHVYSILNDDHDQLYHALKNLRKMIENKDDETSIYNVLTIINYDFYLHFYREEEMMETYKYPELKNHRYTHSVLTQVLQTIISNIVHSNYILTVDDIDHIDNMLTQHIGVDDTPLEKYMSNIKKSNNEEDLFSNIPFSHKIILLVKLLFSHIKKASTTFIMPHKSIPIHKSTIMTPRQRQQEEIRKHHGWYYGNY